MPCMTGFCCMLKMRSDRLAARAVLSESDPQVRLCRVRDGEEALAFLHQTGKHSHAPRPDLVLLDLGLPLRTGFEVLAEIRKSTGLRSLSVVVFSSSSRPSDRRNHWS